MSDLIQIGLNGLHQSLEQLQAVTLSIISPTESSNLAKDIVELKVVERSYQANLAVIKTADELAKTTIDMLI